MPEISEDIDLDEADTSLASIEAQDADVSIDSMGGAAISQQRDIYGGKDRKEVDFVITKVLDDYRQIVLLVVELKRDNVVLGDAIAQIEGYFYRAAKRNNASQFKNRSLLGLLILGAFCVRMEGRYMCDTGTISFVYIDGYVPNSPHIPSIFEPIQRTPRL